MLATITIAFGGLLLLGFPFWLAFLVTSVIAIWFFTTVPLVIAAQAMFGTLDNWVLLAVPGFIFAGELMSQTGMTRSLIQWIRAAIGGLPGGLPITTVAASEFFGAISGSSAAATAAIGKVVYPGLRDVGYSEKFSLGLIACCGPMATIIPPSITMILYASVTGASVGRLFLAGVVPGLVIGVFLSAYVVWHSYKMHIRDRTAADWQGFLRHTRAAAWPLGVPVLIFGGIYSGTFTPTEAAAVSCIYVILVTTIIAKELTWRQFMSVTRASAQLTAKIFLIVATSGLFSWVLTAGKVPQTVAQSINDANLPVWAVLVMINIILLIAGMFIDPASATLVLSPLLWQVAKVVGVDITHFGIVLTVNLGIGMFSPPFGLNLFIASSVFRVPMSRVMSGIWPFATAYVLALILITYYPPLTLWLPGLVMK